MSTAQIDVTTPLLGPFSRRLALQVADALQHGQPYSVITCVPQCLPGEYLADVVDVVTDVVQRLVRKGDLATRLGDHMLVIGLPGTDGPAAKALAHRLQGDLALRTARFRHTVWQAGVATQPEDGMTSVELLQHAVEAAQDRRVRLGRERY